jgi:3D (Asp-Asp-Asp) domain-containing protein
LCALGGLLLASVFAVAPSASAAEVCRLLVEASAYNSVHGQTNAHPRTTAWGTRLEPDVRAIAVSRDLIKAGLGHGAEVWIDGLPGSYLVLDKMAKRWRRKVDIYFGDDVDAARSWGVRKLEIRWVKPGGGAARCP